MQLARVGILFLLVSALSAVAEPEDEFLEGEDEVEEEVSVLPVGEPASVPPFSGACEDGNCNLCELEDPTPLVTDVASPSFYPNYLVLSSSSGSDPLAEDTTREGQKAPLPAGTVEPPPYAGALSETISLCFDVDASLDALSTLIRIPNTFPQLSGRPNKVVAVRGVERVELLETQLSSADSFPLSFVPEQLTFYFEHSVQEDTFREVSTLEVGGATLLDRPCELANEAGGLF